MENKWIWLDMDGTIADFYNVDGWLNDLINHNTRPYQQARLMYDIMDLIEVLADLRSKGWKVGIISWSSKENNPIFDKEVEKAKMEWLEKYFLNYLLDKVIVTPYGQPKHETCKEYCEYGILVDDEVQNLEKWNLGDTVNAKENILESLAKMLEFH